MQGLLDGKYSDIKIKVLGKSYDLHRLVLDRSPFFASALSPPWRESTQNEVELHPEGLDSNITSSSFELALKRLYGCPDVLAEAQEPISTFATGSWLEMKEMIAGSLEALLGQMRPRALGPLINVVTNNYYGRGGNRVLATCKSMLSRDGWSMPMKYWDEIPSEVIKDIVGGDSFFVHNEWRRWLFVRRLLNRRLKAVADELGMFSPPTEVLIMAPPAMHNAAPRQLTANSNPGDIDSPWAALYGHSEILPLLELMDHGIYYMHLNFEQLQHVKSFVDVFGVPLVPAKICDDALWAMCELRQTISVARHYDEDLDLAQTGTFATDGAEADVPSEYQRYFHQKAQLPPNREPSGQSTSSALCSDTPNSFQAPQRRFWIPNVDCNIVTGGEEPIVTLSQDTSDKGASRSPRASQGNTAPQPETYMRFPPFRFAVELPHPRSIKDHKRAGSRPIPYAGSLWNVYMQKKRISGSNTPEVGLYLHRQKEHFSVHERADHGSVDERIGALEREMLLRSRTSPRRGDDLYDLDFPNLSDYEAFVADAANPDDRNAQPSSSRLTAFMTGDKAQTKSRATLPVIDGTSDTEYADEQAADQLDEFRAGMTLPTYIDQRPIIKSYYKISCPAKGGRILSVYESQPDRFKLGQSLGWKCNSLVMEEEDNNDEVDDIEADGNDEDILLPTSPWDTGSTDLMVKGKGRAKKLESKLRLTVVLGVV